MKARGELVGEVCTVWLRGREQELHGRLVSSSAWHLVVECSGIPVAGGDPVTTVWHIDAGEVQAIGSNRATVA